MEKEKKIFRGKKTNIAKIMAENRYIDYRYISAILNFSMCISHSNSVWNESFRNEVPSLSGIEALPFTSRFAGINEWKYCKSLDTVLDPVSQSVYTCFAYWNPDINLVALRTCSSVRPCRLFLPCGFDLEACV